MSKKLILVLVIVVFFFSWGRVVFASLIINEIMYDLPGSDSFGGKSREWIEVYNPDSIDVAVDASKWRIYDGSANRTMNGEVNFSIPSKSYIIFAGDKNNFLIDNPKFSGVVYDAGFTSLNNTGATLKILDQDGNVIDAVSYYSSQGGAGDGNSLQKISNSWTGANPTPGLPNEVAIQNPVTSPVSSGLPANSSNNDTSITKNNDSKSKIAEEAKIKTKIIISKKNYFTNIPLLIEGAAYGYQSERLHYGKYFWNFGDGDSKEVLEANNQPFSHIYFYPGDYVLSLDYYSNPYVDIPDASDQVLIKIVPEDIVISKVGDEKDFFIELSNNTNYDADISNWYLQSDKKIFKIPRNTILFSKNKMLISPKITGFSVEDKNTLKLLTQQGDIVFVFSSSAINQDPTRNNAMPSKISISENNSKINNKEKNLAEADISLFPKLSANDLTASVSDGVVSNTQNKGNTESLPLVPIFSIVFVGASAYTAYFIRQKKNVSHIGGDFEILDE